MPRGLPLGAAIVKDELHLEGANPQRDAIHAGASSIPNRSRRPAIPADVIETTRPDAAR
jgi:hypothetical protein